MCIRDRRGRAPTPVRTGADAATAPQSRVQIRPRNTFITGLNDPHRTFHSKALRNLTHKGAKRRLGRSSDRRRTEDGGRMTLKRRLALGLAALLACAAPAAA